MSPEQSQWEPDELIGVDLNDSVIGAFSKERCHRLGILHRAFSILLFDSAGRMIVQRRSARKPLWPLYWSNACCSHPRFGEDVLAAAHRRLREELGLDTELELLFSFHYFARFEDIGFEHELCSVFAGRTDSPVLADANEIAEWRCVAPRDLERWIGESPDELSPWFVSEWRRVAGEHSRWLEPA